MKKIMFVASEGLPFIKSGGLADVVGSLPQALTKLSCHCSVVMPLYKKIIEQHFEKLELFGAFSVRVGMYDNDVRIFYHQDNGVDYYFVEHAGYFERDSLYGYGDDGERFAFFQHAVYHLIQAFELYPDVIHAHDWHTGMMAALARFVYHNDAQIMKIKQIYTIHNLAYQGNFDAAMLTPCLGIDMSNYYNGLLAFNGGISFMKAGIMCSDKINTVSNTYSYEIMGSAFGEGMEYILQQRRHDLWGIINGIDVDSFNPSKDVQIASKYSVRSLNRKQRNKRELQQSLGLRVSKDVCLVGMVSRLAHQKGINLVLDKMKDIMGLDLQLVILGTGEASYEHHLRSCENMYKRRMVYYGGYSDKVARQIYAGADLFLMPSLFEPCGLSQMIAMRYGTLPIVRETGGLKDTVIPYNQYDQTGTGFSFSNFNGDDMFQTLRYACDVYYLNPHDFNKLQVRAMETDFSWDRSAKLYLQMYQAADMY